MGRNSELIRQWTLLQRVAGSRDQTIPGLSQSLGVSTRTIRRDLAALQEAGFPIYDGPGEGKKVWRVETKSLGALARTGLTLSELCALYFSRALIDCFAGTHLLADVQSALGKFEAALTPQMKKFLDRLPGIVTAKPAGRKKQGADTHRIIAMLLESILHQHVVTMRYHSWSSAKEKEYVVHPYRLAHVQGGLYLIAYVPGYKEVRTFAVERIRSATRSDKSFEPIAEFDADPFTHSLGAYRGARTRITLVFHPRVAAYIKERTWHASQRIRDRADGSVAMTIEVSDDYALRSWILSFGRLVRVTSPPALASWVLEELDGAREQYVSGEFSLIADDRQPGLPFGRLGEG